MMQQKRANFIIWYLILIATLIGCAVIFNKFQKPNLYLKNAQTVLYNIENKRLVLIEATNEAQWEKGLMYVDRNIPIDGMIFKFPNRATRRFWNKNTFVDLDVYWLNGDKVVGRSYLPAIRYGKRETVVHSPNHVNRVIEVIRK